MTRPGAKAFYKNFKREGKVDRDDVNNSAVRWTALHHCIEGYIKEVLNRLVPQASLHSSNEVVALRAMQSAFSNERKRCYSSSCYSDPEP